MNNELTFADRVLNRLHYSLLSGDGEWDYGACAVVALVLSPFVFIFCFIRRLTNV
jgi:hypothetical protein